jgi:hypothetical protein
MATVWDGLLGGSLVIAQRGKCGSRRFATGYADVHNDPHYEHAGHGRVGRREVDVDHVSDYRQGHRSREADYGLPQCADFADCR